MKWNCFFDAARAVWILSAFGFLSCHPTAQRWSDPRAEIARTQQLWDSLGRSVEGETIFYKECGSGDDVILILACTHGDEQIGGHIVVRLTELVCLQKAASLRKKIVFVPVLNPDGVAKGTRTNARGADINRNFPTRNWNSSSPQMRYAPGSSPASEPESQLVLELLTRYKPRLIISLHSSLHMINYDGPAKAVAERMATFNNYRVSDSIGYPTPGSLGTYAGVERNISVITLELPDVSADEAWEQNRDALVDVILR